MKNLTLIALFFLVSNSFIAQLPQGMSYQAVIRDTNGNLITESMVGIRISIIQGSPSGTVVYVETHSPMTNINGLASLIIGMGTPTSGSYPVIDWSVPYYIKTETDPTGGNNYVLISTSQLLAVPYALHALDVSNKDDADSDPTNEIELPPGGQNGQFLRMIEGVPTWVFPDAEPPSIPMNFSFSNETPTSVDLTWNPSTDNISVSGYRLQQNGDLISGITDVTYQVNDLVPMTSYEFYVQAYDLDGNSSDYSNPLYLDREPPTAPQNLFASNFSPSSSTLDLHWSPSTDDNEIYYYEIYQNGALVEVVLAEVLTYQITGLPANTSYDFFLRAMDTSFNLGPASPTIYVDRQPPTVPGDFIATYNPSSNTISFSWTDSQDDLGINLYRIREVNGLIGEIIIPWGIGNVAGTNQDFPGSLQFEIRAEDVSGNAGPWTDMVYVDISPPSNPSTFLVSASGTACPTFEGKFTYSHSASSDDVGVVLYEMFVDGVSVASSPNVIQYQTPCVPISPEPSVCVIAYDAVGNASSCN